MRRTRLAGALTAVLTLALMATGCGGAGGDDTGNGSGRSPSTTGPSTTGASAAARDRVEPLADPGAPPRALTRPPAPRPAVPRTTTHPRG
ncbi:hypothetical protein ACFQ9H_21830, partial [Streptomyces sp. NPDC056517]